MNLTALITVLLAASLPPQAMPETLTLADALRLAASGPAIGASHALTEAAAARAREAGAARRPQLGALAQGRALAEEPGLTFAPGVFGPSSFDLVAGDRATATVGIEVQQLIWDAGRVSASVKAADAERSASDADTATRRRDVALATVKHYSAAVAASQRVDVLRHSLETAEETLRVVTAMVGQELLPRSDQLSSSYFREDINARLAEAESHEAAARAALAALIGREPGVLVLPPATSILATSPEAAFQARPELQALDDRRRAALAASEAAAAEHRPLLVAVGQAGYMHDSYVLNQANASAAVALRVPILDGGRAAARSAQYEAAARALELSAEATRRQVKTELTATAAAERAARQRLAAAERAVVSSAEALRLERLRHGQGLATTRELLEAMTDDTSAQASLAAAAASLTYAIAETASAGGTDLLTVFAKETR